MTIRVKLSSLKEGRWYEYVIRFMLGGVTTLIAGIIADKYGPEAGGLVSRLPCHPLRKRYARRKPRAPRKK
jgi:hypothetical protein